MALLDSVHNPCLTPGCPGFVLAIVMGTFNYQQAPPGHPSGPEAGRTQ